MYVQVILSFFHDLNLKNTACSRSFLEKHAENFLFRVLLSTYKSVNDHRSITLKSRFQLFHFIPKHIREFQTGYIADMITQI